MSRIPSEVFVYWTAFMYASDEAARDPDAPPSAAAVIIPSKTANGNECVTYAVTNHHVIARGGRFLVMSPHKSQPTVRPTQPDEWFHAGKDDLSVLFLGTSTEQDEETLERTHGMFHMNEDAIEALNIGHGDEVIAVGSGGRPNRWLPIARFGNIVSWPPSKMIDGRDAEVELLLVEMRSRGGDSGSPVFLHIGPGSIRDLQGEKVIPFGMRGAGFLGIVCGHMPVREQAEREVDGSTEKFVLTMNTNISLVIPWSRVHALIDEAERIRTGTEGAGG